MIENEVIGPSNSCLGECWALVCHAARTSVLEDREVRVSARVTRSREDVRERLEEILGVLDLGEGRVLVVDEAPTSPLKVTVDTFPYPYVPTKRRWTGKGSGRACCQLVNHQPPNNAKALARAHREEVEAWLEAEFNEVVRLWKDRTIAECVEAAAGSELFIGMDSGMSHLCHSVGVPVLIKEWDGLNRHHPNKEFIQFSNPAEAIAAMRETRKGA